MSLLGTPPMWRFQLHFVAFLMSTHQLTTFVVGGALAAVGLLLLHRRSKRGSSNAQRAKILAGNFGALRAEMEAATGLALECGDAMRAYLTRGKSEVTWKDDGGIDPVTQTDQVCSAASNNCLLPTSACHPTSAGQPPPARARASPSERSITKNFSCAV